MQRDEIVIDKNRHGECSTVPCQFIQHLMRWAGSQDEY
jgi:replicative DNA helicase